MNFHFHRDDEPTSTIFFMEHYKNIENSDEVKEAGVGFGVQLCLLWYIYDNNLHVRKRQRQQKTNELRDVVHTRVYLTAK